MAGAVKTRRAYDATLRQQHAGMTRSRVLAAARRLLAAGTYSSVTMADIAKEAGVAYQTVYGIFGTKVRLADAVIAAGFSHIPEAMKLFDGLLDSSDPEHWLRITAHATRLILEPCADLARFIRESGDPGLLDGFRSREQARYAGIVGSGLPGKLETCGRMRDSLTPSEAIAVIWALTGADLYNRFVFDLGWTPTRYEEWLADAMVKTLLQAPSHARHG